MADNYLERQREIYEQRKALWLQGKLKPKIRQAKRRGQAH
ncbi:MAG: dehydrogenase [Bacteroidales bacterium]|nr:dehydrogenase [Bacteroidales bacterium]